jgi:hypothetical protein
MCQDFLTTVAGVDQLASSGPGPMGAGVMGTGAGDLLAGGAGSLGLRGWPPTT